MSVTVTYARQDDEQVVLAQGIADHPPVVGATVRFADLVTGELLEQRWHVTSVVHGVFQRPGFGSHKTFLGATARVLCAPAETEGGPFEEGLRAGMVKAASIAGNADVGLPEDDPRTQAVVYGIELAAAAIREWVGL